MKCLLTHHTASCFKIYPSGIFTSKAPSNKPLHKRCCRPLCILQHLHTSYCSQAKFETLGSRMLKRPLIYRALEFQHVCRRHGQQLAINFRRTIFAMFQSTLKVNPLFSNIFSCKVLRLSSKYFCPTVVFCTFLSKTYHQETTRDM